MNELRSGLLQLYRQTPDANQRATIRKLIDRTGGPPILLTGEEAN